MSVAAHLESIRTPDPLKVELRGERSAKQPAWLTEAVADVVHAARGTVKAIAFALGVPQHAVYQAADRFDPKPLKAWWIPAIVQETGSFAILDAIEARVGRVAFKLPAVNPRRDEMSRELARTVKEFGAFLECNGDVLADGRIEPHELKPLLASLDQIVADIAEYRALVVRRAEQDAAA